MHLIYNSREVGLPTRLKPPTIVVRCHFWEIFRKRGATKRNESIGSENRVFISSFPSQNPLICSSISLCFSSFCESPFPFTRFPFGFFPFFLLFFSGSFAEFCWFLFLFLSDFMLPLFSIAYSDCSLFYFRVFLFCGYESCYLIVHWIIGFMFFFRSCLDLIWKIRTGFVWNFHACSNVHLVFLIFIGFF